MSFDYREQGRKRADEDILRNNRDLAALNTITAAVSSSLDLPEILEKLKSLLAEQFDVPGGIIFFYEEGDDSLNLEAAWGVPAAILSEFKRLPVDRYHYKQVVRDKNLFLRSDLRAVPPFFSLGLHEARPSWLSYLCVPLVAKGEVQGALDLFSRRPVEFTQEQIALFNTLGQQVGVAIQNARLYEQVRSGRQQLRLLSQQLLEVQESERRHIARELHDEIGQALTAVKVNLQASLRLAGTQTLTPYLEESISIIERTFQQIRNLSLELRPSLLDDLGVVAALRWYIDRQARRAGFEARFLFDPPELHFSPELETTCFRVVQEALTNVVRHAHAKNVLVELNQSGSEVELLIRDDGIGFDVRSAMQHAGDISLGLVGMQERVQLIGGWITIESDPDSGTEILAHFPVNRPKTDQDNGQPDRRE